MALVPTPPNSQAAFGSTLFDFEERTGNWSSIDDRVMGGVSASSMVIENGVAVFSGTVSLDFGGGFASVRTLPARHDLSGLEGVVLELRGDGHRYGFRLRTDDRFDGVSWMASFPTEPGRRLTVVLPFAAFRPTLRGRVVSEAGPFDPAAVQSFGFLIGDRQAGEFRLEIDRIAGWNRPSDDHLPPQDAGRRPAGSGGG